VYDKLLENSKGYGTRLYITWNQTFEWTKAAMATILAHFFAPCTLIGIPFPHIAMVITTYGALRWTSDYCDTLSSFRQHLQNAYSANFPKCLDQYS